MIRRFVPSLVGGSGALLLVVVVAYQFFPQVPKSDGSIGASVCPDTLVTNQADYFSGNEVVGVWTPADFDLEDIEPSTVRLARGFVDDLDASSLFTAEYSTSTTSLTVEVSDVGAEALTLDEVYPVRLVVEGTSDGRRFYDLSVWAVSATSTDSAGACP